MKNLEEMVAKPTSGDLPPVRAISLTKPFEPTHEPIEKEEADNLPQGALDALEAAGMDPKEYEIKSAWMDHEGKMQYSFRKTTPSGFTGAILSDFELSQVVSAKKGEYASQDRSQQDGDKTALVLLGDMQFGTIEDDGIAGTLARLEHALDMAAFEIDNRMEDFDDVQEIVVGFLGDHVEGFISQGGANAWRTPMPLTEQIRVTRRTMLHAMKVFGDFGIPLKMVAIPGNHGRTTAIEGKGVTRYDDSFDTEALIAVADAARISDLYQDVQFFVPETDELSVGLDCSGTYVMFTHGDKARGGKVMEWMKGQAFNRDSPYAGVDLGVFGHWHHFNVDTDSDRMTIIVPTFINDSAWFRHSTGTTSDPGLVVAYTSNGRTDDIKLIR